MRERGGLRQKKERSAHHVLRLFLSVDPVIDSEQNSNIDIILEESCHHLLPNNAKKVFPAASPGIIIQEETARTLSLSVQIPFVGRVLN
jgi:hypothetical protein